MKHLFQLSLFLLALLLPATALAHDFEVDGIYYNICSATVAEVTYKQIVNYSFQSDYSGSVIIPSTVTYDGTTYTVTSIGLSAFEDCSGLTSVTIPTSVSYIEVNAFYGCSGLTSITIPNSVTFISSYAFSGCSSLTSIDIPNSVTSIGRSAFSGCSGLTCIKVASGNPTYDSRSDCNAIIETATNMLITGCQNTTIPNSVTTIGDNAFYGCSGLTSITIPNSVTSIGNSVFSGCSSLAYVTIGNSVTSIGNYTFSRCSSLTSIDIPNSVTTIGNKAFEWCESLTSIDIPNSVTLIGRGAFSGCSGLTSIKVMSSNSTYDSRSNCNAIIETASNTLIAGCQNSVIPQSVTSIGVQAFSGCTGMTSVTIPNSVTSIGGYAFYGCSGLTCVTIPNSVSSIGDRAFNGSTGLVEIYCFALVPPTIESLTFSGCYGAILYVSKESVNAYRTANYWKKFTNIVGFVECVGVFEVDGILYRAMNDGTATVIANEEMENYYIGDKVIADTVTFEGNNYVVTFIEDNAFSDCYELTSITIPNSVETIGEQAFQGCTGLKSVTIGSGVTAIGAKAFNYCNALETVKCLGTVPPVMASADCFSTAAYNRATLLVPRNSEATYAAADYWYKFAHIDGWGSAGRGDVNGDGVMSILDVTSLIDVLLGNEMESFYFESADLNNNGRIDIGDVTSLIDNLLNGDY